MRRLEKGIEQPIRFLNLRTEIANASGEKARGPDDRVLPTAVDTDLQRCAIHI